MGISRPRSERLASIGLCALDVLLAALLVAALVVDPLAFSHGVAIVLVIQAFLLDARPASVRLRHRTEVCRTCDRAGSVICNDRAARRMHSSFHTMAQVVAITGASSGIGRACTRAAPLSASPRSASPL